METTRAAGAPVVEIRGDAGTNRPAGIFIGFLAVSSIAGGLTLAFSWIWSTWQWGNLFTGLFLIALGAGLGWLVVSILGARLIADDQGLLYKVPRRRPIRRPWSEIADIYCDADDDRSTLMVRTTTGELIDFGPSSKDGLSVFRPEDLAAAAAALAAEVRRRGEPSHPLSPHRPPDADPPPLELLLEIRAPGWGPRLREAGLSLILLLVWCVLLVVTDLRNVLVVAIATNLFWTVKGLVRQPFPGDVILQADARGLRWWGHANGDAPWTDVDALLPATRNPGIILIDSQRRAHRLPRLPGRKAAEVIAEIEARRPPR